MRKRAKIALILVVLAIVGWAAWGLLYPGEPRYDGRPISYWINRSGGEYWPKYSWRHLPSSVNDSNAVPFLIKALKRQDSLFARAYSWGYSHLPNSGRRWLPARINAARIRAEAAAHLGSMGQVARPAVPALLCALKEEPDPVMQVFVATSLLKLSKGDTATVVTALRALNGATLEQEVLESPFTSTMPKPWPKEAVSEVIPTLIKCLDNADQVVRIGATNLLFKLDPTAAAKAGVNTNAPGR